MRWTEEDLDAARRRLNATSHPTRSKLPQRVSHSKFGNEPTFHDGKRFASKKEASYYLQLKLAKAMDQIRGFACQVSIPLPSGKRRMVIDFLVIELDGRVRWVDTKGMVLDAWATKRDELEHSLGIKIEIV